MTNTSPMAILKAIFAHDPNAGLHEIHQSHPLLRAMSLDHLGLQLGRLIDDHADGRM